MDSKDLFINVMIAILLLSIYQYTVTLSGLKKYNNITCPPQPIDPIIITDKTDTKDIKAQLRSVISNTEDDEKCQKKRQYELTRSILSILLGFALLFNKRFIDTSKTNGDIGLGLSVTGFILILLSIGDFFQGLSDVVILFTLISILSAVLYMYTNQ